MLNFYCLRGLAPPGFDFAYFCRTPFHTRPRLRFHTFSTTPRQRVSSFLAALFAANLPPHACQFGHKSPVRQTTIFHLPAAPRFGEFRVSILAGSSLSVTSFRWFRYSLAGSRISSCTSSHRSVTSLPYPLHCCRKFFLLCQSSGSSDCRIEFVIIFTSLFVFLEKFASGSVPTLIRSNFVLVPIRHGSILFAIVPFHRRTRCSLVNFNKSLRSVSAY